MYRNLEINENHLSYTKKQVNQVIFIINIINTQFLVPLVAPKKIINIS